MSIFFKKHLFYQIILILLLSLSISIVTNLLRLDSIPFIMKGGKDAATKGGITYLEFEDMQEIINNKDIVIVDARDDDLYYEGHIPEAINLPLKEVESLIHDFISRVSFESSVIIYCEGYGCDMGERLALIFEDYGFSNLMVYDGGIEEWASYGMPIEKD